MGLVFLFSVPIGVMTAVYLEEYADKERWYNRLLELNIQNLAGVPSIVYGILGLAFLVRGIGLGRTLLAGALILTLLVLPTVIIAAREAIRAVPPSIRDGAYALGATQWQVTYRQVLPAAIPGIATGSILALSRAIGETAPLLLVGALTYVRFNPSLDSAVHRAAGADLQLDQAASGGVQVPGGRRYRGAAGHAADPERLCDLACATATRRDGEMTSMTDLERQGTTPMPAPGRTARLAEPDTDVVFDVQGLRRLATAGKLALKDVDMKVLPQSRDRLHRPVRVRQEHVHPLLQPHERPDRRRRVDGQVLLPRPGSLRRPRSTRSRCASGSGWCSRSRTRSRNRSTTTSPSAPACWG